MSDPLLDFLLSRDPEKVLAEARPVPLERLYAEASVEDRELIDELPVGVIRRRLLDAERLLAEKRTPKVRVIGNPELMRALHDARAERDRLVAENQDLRGRVTELRVLLDGKARAA